MKQLRSSSLFWAEEGFSTVGMVLALLISISLIFTAARVYEINSCSSRVQEVADAAALAAENTVGEFYLVAGICDAVLLSLSLTTAGCLGLSVVCACVPPASGFSKTFLEMAQKTKKARDSFSKSANESLERLAQALPFIAAVKAQEVYSANSSLSDGAHYQGIVVLSPWEVETGDSLSFHDSDESLSEVEQSRDSLEDVAAQAEEAAKRANEWKQYGHEHDSISPDAYCMYERAAKLAGMAGSDNPFFSSVDTWSFGASLERAKTYYRLRYQTEAPNGQSVDELSNSALRKRFYAYAQETVGRGYVHETELSFEAFFPRLPKNTDEMRSTILYTEAVYPKTIDAQGLSVLHAWSGCPGLAQGSNGVGSIQEMDAAGSYAPCPYCKFVPSSMGKVAAASSSIQNGFEYHYNEVAKAADEYQKAREELDPLNQQAKDMAGGLLDSVGKAFVEACSQRIDITPPGHYGVISLVSDTGTAQTRFPSSLVSSEGVGGLGARVALSSATLVKESSDEGRNVVASFLDGLSGEGSAVVGAAKIALRMWSGFLGVYTQGHDALLETVESVLNGIPLMGASGLGSWASGALKDTVEGFGFAPVDLAARKAVLVNSQHVLKADDSAFSARLLSAKEAALMSQGNGGIDGALSCVQSAAMDAIAGLGGEFTIATIVLFDGVVEIPVTVALPQAITGGFDSSSAAWCRFLEGNCLERDRGEAMGVMFRKTPGQMTIEFVVAFPAMIAVAFVAINAVLFFSDCASFDRVFRNAVCTYAASPAYEQETGESCELIQSQLEESLSRDNLRFQVSSSGVEGGMVTFSAQMYFEPTLFGKGRLSGVFGFSFPPLSHGEQISVSAYKPGLVF